MSILPIAISAGQTLPASDPVISAIARRGTICQDMPKRSFSQPHRDSAPPSAINAAQSRSVSAWSSVITRIEAASDRVKCGPPFNAM